MANVPGIQPSTPGPWNVRKGLGGSKYLHITSAARDNLAVATVPADACLIAAAPELLAVLRDALIDWNTQFEGTQDDDAWCVAARAVISKATGSAA